MGTLRSHIASIPVTVWLAIAYIVGVLEANHAATIPCYFILLLIATGLNRYYLIKPIRALLILFGIACIGNTRSQQTEAQRQTRESTVTGKKVCIKTVILDQRITEEPYEELLTVEIQQLRHRGKLLAPPSHTIIQAKSIHPTGIRTGDTIIIHDAYIQGCGKEWIPHAQKQGICGYLRIHKSTTIDILDSQKNTLHELRTALLNTIQKTFSPITKNLFQALFLGYRTKGPDTSQALFEQWGISHMLARSGLHVMILISIIQFLLLFVPVHIRYKQMLALLFLIGYTVLSWPSVSYLRAFYTSALMIVSHLCSLRTHPLHLISLVCLGLLIYQPYYLYGLDFQLSFALAFVLALIGHGNNLMSNNLNFNR